MTDVSITDGQKLDLALAALTATQDLIAAALSTLKSNTLEGGRVSPAKLDDYQLISYEIALCWAECSSARFLLDYASRLREEAPGAADFAGHESAERSDPRADTRRSEPSIRSAPVPRRLRPVRSP